MKLTKCLVFLLCLSILFSLVACGNSNTPPPVEGPSINNGGQNQTPSKPNKDETEKEPEKEPGTKPGQSTEIVYKELSLLEWKNTTGVVEGDEIQKDKVATLGNGSYTFDKTLAVTPAAVPVNESSVGITYDLGKQYHTFSVMVGLDDSAKNGSVEFLVFVDGSLSARSGKMLPGEYLYLACSVYRSETLTLMVTNFDGENTGDCAIWGDPKLIVGWRYEKPAAALPLDVDYTIDAMEWNSARCLHDDTKGAPFINKNEGGGKLSMCNGFFKPSSGIWLHPRDGEDGYAEIEINLESSNVSKFVATFGLSDEYVNSVDGLKGAVDYGRRSVEFIFLIDGVEVAACELVNSIKLGTIVLDVSTAKTLTIRMTSYDGRHTCDAGVITGGFVK